ncbi:MAG: tetratricopeptide repeat protein [Nitrospiria bacterium]
MKCLCAAMLLFLSTACANPEGKSQALYETAQFEEEQRNFKHARQLYEEIIKKYPEASYAEKARARLKAIEETP